MWRFVTVVALAFGAAGCVKTISPDGFLIEMNPAGLSMLSATTLEQVKAKPLLEWIAPEHHAQFIELHRKVMAGESELVVQPPRRSRPTGSISYAPVSTERPTVPRSRSTLCPARKRCT